MCQTLLDLGETDFNEPQIFTFQELPTTAKEGRAPKCYPREQSATRT